MLNTRGLLFFAILSVSGCATVPVVNAEADLKAITADVKQCVSQDAPAAIQLVERNAGPALYEAFMCDAGDGFDPSAIPACLTEAFSIETAGLGVDAEAFKTCVISKVEGDPNIKPLAKQRAHLMKVQRAAQRK
jgi:hypothetical protein